MPQQQLLKKVVQVLNSLQIDFMVSGSYASSMHGQPRATHDIDLVVSLDPESVSALVDAFPPPDYYLPGKEAMLRAVHEQSMFNLIDTTEGDKVDFWMLTSEPFDQSRFTRKMKEQFLGLEIPVSSPEDTILMKLKWARDAGGSEKQFTDALRVYEVQAPAIDHQYLHSWSVILGVQALLKQLMEQARPED
jgi:hypothetical protein